MKILLLLLAFVVFPSLYAVEVNTYKVVTDKYNGSAFYYSETRLFTAAHLFGKDEKKCVLIDKDNIKIVCEVVKIDFKSDICVLESQHNDTWFKIKDFKVMGIGFVKGERKESSGVITKFESNNETIDGFSGGPLIEKQSNEVFGMIVRNGSLGNKNVCKIVYGSELLEFIKNLSPASRELINFKRAE